MTVNAASLDWKVAAHFECVNALVDLQARKTTPYPAEILTRIDAMLAEQRLGATDQRRDAGVTKASGSRPNQRQDAFSDRRRQMGPGLDYDHEGDVDSGVAPGGLGTELATRTSVKEQP